MPNFLNDLLFLVQRLDWVSILDLFLVTLVFFGIFMLVRDTQAMVLLRGILLLVVLLAVLTSLVNLPAFSWLIQTTLPALLLAIPVIFAPEIRRALERIGRAGWLTLALRQSSDAAQEINRTIHATVVASTRLASMRQGALIVLQRHDILSEYTQTGVLMNSTVTPELLLQIFYPNTPLHDGAVIIANNQLVAAGCVMPLSSSGVLRSTPDKHMGLRHRAALGISEASDAVAVVVSEETGMISIAYEGRMVRHLDIERLENVLTAFYRPENGASGKKNWLIRLFPGLGRSRPPEE